MSSTLQKPVLVLNKGWTPVGTVSVQRAIVMLFSVHKDDGTPKAKIIEPESYAAMSWADWSKLKPRVTDEVIRAANIAFRCPEVIVLTRYDKFPEPKSHFCRRTLYKRDGFRCQYCGCQPGTSELSVDHVIPRSLGGETSWTNCVCCCVPCNAKKANKTLVQSGLKLLRTPVKPKAHLFKNDVLRPVKSWSNFISDAFWEVPLQD